MSFLTREDSIDIEIGDKKLSRNVMRYKYVEDEVGIIPPYIEIVGISMDHIILRVLLTDDNYHLLPRLIEHLDHKMLNIDPEPLSANNIDKLLKTYPNTYITHGKLQMSIE